MAKNILLLLFGLVLCSFTILVASAEQITVSVDSGADFSKIQDAINEASKRDTIFVKSGIYREHLVIDKQVTLKGEEYPSIDGGETGTVIWIRADDVRIEGFQVMQSDPARKNRDDGIRLSANNGIVKDSIISNNNIGIGISGMNNVVSNCKFNDNRIGLVISDGGQNTVQSSHFVEGGLILDNTENNLIKNNIIELGSTPGVSIYNKANNNIIVGNTIRSNSMVAFEIIESEWGPTSNGNQIYHNNIIDNGREYQVYDDGNNQWDNGVEGNYWSDYEGKDADGDGIGDVPYNNIGDAKTSAKSGAKDNYPLMEQLIESGDFKIGTSVMPWSEPIPNSNRYSFNKGEYTELVKELHDKGINRIFVSVFETVELDGIYQGVFYMKKNGNWGKAVKEPIYPHWNNDKPYFDLEKLLTEAHKLDMEVYVTVNCFKLTYYNNGSIAGGIDLTGTDGVNQQVLIFSVIDYLLNNFKDGQNRGIDGIELDYVRYVEPLSAGDDDATIPLFIKNLNKQVIGGKVKLSASVCAATNDIEYEGIKSETGQNYESMSEYLDFISPMAYSYGDPGVYNSKPPTYKSPSYVGDVTKFVKLKVKKGCLVVPHIQGYDYYKEGKKEISVIENPGFNEILKMGKSAYDSGAEGVNIFRYHHLSDDELNAIEALAEDDFERSEIDTSMDTVPAIKKPPEKSIPGIGTLGVAIVSLVVFVLRRKQI